MILNENTMLEGIYNKSTSPLWQWGFRQCLPFSWKTLRGKHCPHPIAVMGVVEMFGPCFVWYWTYRTGPLVFRQTL